MASMDTGGDVGGGHKKGPGDCNFNRLRWFKLGSHDEKGKNQERDIHKWCHIGIRTLFWNIYTWHFLKKFNNEMKRNPFSIKSSAKIICTVKQNFVSG